MRKLFKNGDIIQHFKREWIEDKLNDSRYLYKYLGEARYSEDKSQKFVMYMALYDDPENDIKLFDCFVRPFDMFYSEVDKMKYPNASQKYRFEMYIEAIREGEDESSREHIEELVRSIYNE